MPIGQKVVLIGGGHNALITAFYLAKGGFKPTVFRAARSTRGRRDHRGISSRLQSLDALAHPRPLRADITRDLQLHKFNLHIIQPEPRVFAPSPGWPRPALLQLRRQKPSQRFRIFP